MGQMRLKFFRLFTSAATSQTRNESTPVTASPDDRCKGWRGTHAEVLAAIWISTRIVPPTRFLQLADRRAKSTNADHDYRRRKENRCGLSGRHGDCWRWGLPAKSNICVLQAGEGQSYQWSANPAGPAPGTR